MATGRTPAWPTVEFSNGKQIRTNGLSSQSTHHIVVVLNDEYAFPNAMFDHRNRTICDGSTDPNKEPICGRPLGLKFETKTCNLYIADAYFGLLMVGPNGGVPKTIPISAADALPLKYLNGIDVDDQTGILYLSQSSTVYERREVQSMIRNGDKTGRLLTYDPSSKKVQVLLEGLQDANGVALSKDASFLLIIESIPKTIHKFWLKGSKAYTSEFFAQFERAPDNIKRNKNGDFWVGLYSNRTSSEVASDASLQKQAQVSWKKKEEEGDPVGVKFDENGEITGVLDGRGGRELDSVSEVEERGGKLWIGSLVKPYVAVLEIAIQVSESQIGTESDQTLSQEKLNTTLAIQSALLLHDLGIHLISQSVKWLQSSRIHLHIELSLDICVHEECNISTTSLASLSITKCVIPPACATSTPFLIPIASITSISSMRGILQEKAPTHIPSWSRNTPPAVPSPLHSNATSTFNFIKGSFGFNHFTSAGGLHLLFP
ncbi:protein STRICTOSIDINE SYNTHASE-LIKE 10-like [Senna tora]|uniref:Protein STRICTOSIDINE SYNTHASE-LIKE 10-like n=1 Tax=Senna tora TaxID=362788 RepID=A0A834TT61_9FABA|nr:protein STRICTOSIDINE SYNTHASE-LIKE 10-like [Senna tora]